MEEEKNSKEIEGKCQIGSKYYDICLMNKCALK